MALKDIVKQVIPHGICEYSIRRHEYMRLGFGASQASWIGLSSRQYENLREARLNLVPKSILSNLRTCVDAGANMGSWTQALIDRFGPQRVISVECEPRVLGPLKERFRDFPQVTVVEAALADRGGTAKFHQLRHPAGSSLLEARAEVTKEFEAHSWDLIGTVEVQTVSYDQLVADEDEISILKLDIQGAEMGVLSKSQEGLV